MKYGIETWDEIWNEILDKNGLSKKVDLIDQIYLEKDVPLKIKDICRNVATDYDSEKDNLEVVRQELIREVEKLPGSHLMTSRVKTLESLLVKIISKRSEFIRDERNIYNAVSDENYRDIFSDLVGIRLILSYRGQWNDMHREIVKLFPYPSDGVFEDDGRFLPHPLDGSNLMVERPVAYYCPGDDVSIYDNADIEKEIKESGYRSVHYTVSFHGVYVEIQVRTIYDEAWSDCNHSYVYKKDSHVSHEALKELSDILGLFTRASDGLNDIMHDVFENRRMPGTTYKPDDEMEMQAKAIYEPVEEALKRLKKFTIAEEEGNE